MQAHLTAVKDNLREAIQGKSAKAEEHYG